MKLFFCVLAFLVLPYSGIGQFNVGILGGINYSHLLEKTNNRTINHVPGRNFFLSALGTYPVHEKLKFTATSGWSAKVYTDYSNRFTYRRKFNFITFSAGVEFGMSNRIGIGFQMYTAYLMNEKEQIGDWQITEPLIRRVDHGLGAHLRFYATDLVFLDFSLEQGLQNLQNDDSNNTKRLISFKFGLGFNLIQKQKD